MSAKIEQEVPMLEHNPVQPDLEWGNDRDIDDLQKQEAVEEDSQDKRNEEVDNITETGCSNQPSEAETHVSVCGNPRKDKDWEQWSTKQLETECSVKKPGMFKFWHGNYNTFLLRFKRYLEAHDINEGDKVNVLIGFMGARAQRKIVALNLTDEDKKDVEKCYDRIGAILVTRKNAKNKICAIRQRKKETISHFMTRLQDLCRITYEKDDVVREQIVFHRFIGGILNSGIAVDIMQNRIIDWQMAFQRALELESICGEGLY